MRGGKKTKIKGDDSCFLSKGFFYGQVKIVGKYF
jgi:hypothetical protein